MKLLLRRADSRVLKDHQARLGAKELSRKYGVSDATFFEWRSKYSGMEVSEAQKLKALEVDNAKLKKMLAEKTMDVSTLKVMPEGTFEARFMQKPSDPGHHRDAIQTYAGLRLD